MLSNFLCNFIIYLLKSKEEFYTFTHKFIVPDYYPQFACKCGDCRSTCCNGWGISLTTDEYFRLLGLECSAELRRKLDTAFHLADERSPEHYALMNPRFDGHCRLQADDGYCMLQRECGENVLTAVCRYYPRAPRTSPLCECCTSASCEATLELLFADENPVRFIETELNFDFDEPPRSDVDAAYYSELRGLAFSTLADRSIGFEARLQKLGNELYHRDNIALPIDSETDNEIELAYQLFVQLSHTSQTFSELIPCCERFLSSIPDTSGASFRVDSHVREIFPQLDIYYEKLFVNHIFYKGFPNSFPHQSEHQLADEFAPLAATFALVKLISASYMVDKSSLSDFVDVVSELFRVIEHSRFDECALKFVQAHQINPFQLMKI
ncbi:MAG: hypothetical protein HFE63_08880 [Clostridiales bacterium]|nr:hypothetical protein [Clostridiales bacterium]